MVKTGATYQPELIELMKTALGEAASTLPVARQTPAMKVKLASRILSAAARGIRDPIQLRVAALMEIEEVEDELHRSYAQLRRLRQRVEKAEAADSRRNCTVHRGTRRVAARARPPTLSPSAIKRARMSPNCPVCEDCGWVCEDHADTPWSGEHACICGGARMPCPKCNSSDLDNPLRPPAGIRIRFDEKGWRH
jgi:hypothetical protein